jgi:hypothetical protein
MSVHFRDPPTAYSQKLMKPTPILSSGVPVFAALAAGVFLSSAAERSADGFREGGIERPLRYAPDGKDFVITNGGAFFNRPLYGGSSSFRVDAGDMPEFSLYLPGRGGNLRLGIRAGGREKWLHQAERVEARYRQGMMHYAIRDPLLGSGELRLAVLVIRDHQGVIVRSEAVGIDGIELLLAFGGVDGWRGRRNGDIGCEDQPVSQLFQLTPGRCQDNEAVIGEDRFSVSGKPGVVAGVLTGSAGLAVTDAAGWDDAGALFSAGDPKSERPVVRGALKLPAGRPEFIGLQWQEEESGNPQRWSGADLSGLYAREEATLRGIAGRLVVETPDPFVNAAVAALNMAEEAVWDDRRGAYLHGGVAWRIPLLGWRVSYAGNVLGEHGRTAKHFEGYARRQNTKPVPSSMPPPEESANLARNETALHSNGDMMGSHYDMNLVGVDAFFRHLLWTGDLDFARRMWPVIERHLAWERRLFRREFGVEKLPLYEAYCCIWASDDLAYNGGGGTHSSAYNLHHNRMAARVAALLGKDPGPYLREAELIGRGMRKHLWLGDRGWFGEWKDLLGRQLVHPEAALWTFYHTVDSEVPSALEAWQMTRFVDTRIPRFPIEGPGAPAGSHTLSTTSWMPYTWSLNNVVFAESMHTALGFWQANRPEGAFPLFKGALLDSMFLGECPGNVGMCTWYDAVRRESQRDFGDGVGAMARTVVEGLFGVRPDLLAGEVALRPGFPADWNRADLRHPDFRFGFEREGSSETYTWRGGAKPVRLRLEIPALRDEVADVEVNGSPGKWRVVEDAVGLPRIGIETESAREHVVVIHWRGRPPAPPVALGSAKVGAHVAGDCGDGVETLTDPQDALAGERVADGRIEGHADGTAGHRTLFALTRQGDMKWWRPITLEILPDLPQSAPVDWRAPVSGEFDALDLTSAFNDSVTRIFKNEYLSPRSPFCSLATPKQGIGSWCHPAETFEVDDSGLRETARQGGGKITLPNGVPIATPGEADARNIAFVTMWDNYPDEITVPLEGRSSHAFLLMAGSTDAMKSRFDNGEVIVTYADGSTRRLALHNPTTWWPIDKDFYFDDFAFRQGPRGDAPVPLPPRLDLATGRVRILDHETFKGKGRTIRGGAATVLDLPLDASKELRSLTVRALANEVVIGLMGVTLRR